MLIPVAEATEPVAPDHLVVPLEVVPITVASWMQRHLQPQGTWHQRWGEGGSSNFTLDVAIAPTTLGPPVKMPAHQEH